MIVEMLLRKDRRRERL